MVVELGLGLGLGIGIRTGTGIGLEEDREVARQAAIAHLSIHSQGCIHGNWLYRHGMYALSGMFRLNPIIFDHPALIRIDANTASS